MNMVYVLSGNGSVAGSDLARLIVEKCQHAGVLWDSDLPEYTLDFATQIPSVSKSIREGNEAAVVEAVNARLRAAEAKHDSYLILCLTAHRLIPRLKTRMACLDLWKASEPRLQDEGAGPIAYLGTLESLPPGDTRFLTLPDHADRIGDLITSVKRGYARLGENYAAHPRRLLKAILEQFESLGATRFFIVDTDLHACRADLMAHGIKPECIVDILEVAADAILEHAGRSYTTEFCDDVSDARMRLRYKYLTHSDSPQPKKKTYLLYQLMDALPPISAQPLRLLDIGGSSTGHALRLARTLSASSCDITLLDISEASLDAARRHYADETNIETTFVQGDIQSFVSEQAYDVVLCLGVLLCLSSDAVFQATVARIATTMKPGGILLARDSLHDASQKAYMAFGGVIRSRTMYEHTFASAGFELTGSNEFVIDEPIRRTILTSAWCKR